MSSSDTFWACSGRPTCRFFWKSSDTAAVVRQEHHDICGCGRELVEISEEEFKSLECEAVKIEFKCPSCESKNVIDLHKYTCSKCGFSIPAEFKGRVIGSPNIALLLTKGKTELIEGFYSSRVNKNYAAYIVLRPDLNLGFHFPERTFLTVKGVSREMTEEDV